MTFILWIIANIFHPFTKNRKRPDVMVKGANCGCCGAWMPDKMVVEYWRWSVCRNCARGYTCFELWDSKLFENGVINNVNTT